MSILEKSSSIELSRRPGNFAAKRSSYSLGQQVQVEVDTQREYLDFENARLKMKLKFTAGTPTGLQDTTQVNKWGASALIKNLRVKTLGGQMIGNEIREYRAWYRMMKELVSNSDLDVSYNQILEGSLSYKDVAAGISDGTADVEITYAHRFMAHIFTIKEYYPAHFHQGIMIEFDLPQNTSEIFNIDHASAAALPTAVTVEDIYFLVDLVQLKPEIENAMVSLMEQQRLFADYQEVLTQENALGTNAGVHSYDIVGIDGRVKSIHQYTILAATQTGFGAAQSGDYLGTRGKNNMTNYRFKLGSNYLNYESISTVNPTVGNNTAEQIYELLKSLDLHDQKSMYHQAGSSSIGQTSTGALNLETNNFVVGVSVDKAQKNKDETISSMVDKDRNNVRVELTFSASPGANATSYTHITLDKRIQILPGSIVRNVRN